MKKLVFNSIFCLALLPLSLFSQQDPADELSQELQLIQEKMSQMLENLGNLEDQSSFFFSDSLNFNDLSDFRDFPIDSMIQGFSFLFPGMGVDSMGIQGFGNTDELFGPDFQNQLDQMFRSFEELDPSYFEGMEDLIRELEQNGIRPDGLEPGSKGKPKKKKKVYKL